MLERINIIGNSVAVRVRPDEGGMTYSELLFQAGYSVKNSAEPASMIGDLTLPDEDSSTIDSSVLIIHFGIVEASNRSLNRPLYTFMMQDQKGLGRLSKIQVLFLRKLESTFRKHLVLLRGKKSWMRIEEFENRYSELIEREKAKKKEICIGINKPSERIELNLPGTIIRAREYNEAIKRLCNQMDLTFVHPNQCISAEHTPDGIHFNAEGHRIISEMIKASIEQ